MAADDQTRAKIEGVIEELRPFFQADGGDVEFVEMDDAGVVRARLVGACHGCPSSLHTLQNGLKVALEEVLPAVTGVESV